MNVWHHGTMKPTPERLKEVIDYDPDKGTFVWAVSRRGARKGAICGRICSFGYREIGIDYGLYRANMIAWAIMTGEWPSAEVDHINRIKDDDRWENLRLANRSQNCGNDGLRKNNTSGYKGVTLDVASGLWRAQIRLNGRKTNLGRFPTKEEAAAAHDRAAIASFAEFAVTNTDLRL